MTKPDKPKPDIGELARLLQSAKTTFDTRQAAYDASGKTLEAATAAFDQAVTDLRQRTGNGQAGPVGELVDMLTADHPPTVAITMGRGRYVGAEFTAAEWLDANEPEIPGDLRAKLGMALGEAEAADHIKLGPAEYTRLTVAECAKREIPGPPKELGSVVLVVATAKVEKVLEGR